MSFISYAQNFEDVMLDRALRDVEKGFYIDVGANDPVIDSVTKAFYDSGWRGINIEPVKEFYEKLQQDRPEDINLQLAVGARKGRADFYEVVGTGLSTMEESIATQHSQEHGYELRKYKVKVARLTTICEEHPHTDIHFIKIDVEGAEQSVLQGLDLKNIRPWIVLIESTLPNLQVENHEEWEHLLTKRGYHYVYFDGLNRYYVADEHDELDKAFTAPPNYFDSFKRANESWLENHVRQLESEQNAAQASINQMKLNAEQVEASLQATELQRQQLESQVHALQAEAQQRNESLSEKETRLQEANATLTEDKRQIEMLHAELSDSKAQQQTLEAALQGAREQWQQLESQRQILQTEANQRDEALREKEARLQESNATLTDNNQKIGQLKTSLNESEEQNRTLEASLQDAQQQCQQQETQLQTLKEQGLQREETLREKEESINWLNNEWEATKLQVGELQQSNHHWWSMADQQLKELDEAKAKIDVLNNSSHHWWLEADRLDKELQSVYNSKSWKITWPLRELMKLIKRPLLALMRLVLSRPRLELLTNKIISIFPYLKEKLKSFAINNHLITEAGVPFELNQQPFQEVAVGFEQPVTLKSPPSLPDETDNLDEFFSADAIARVSIAIHKGIDK